MNITITHEDTNEKLLEYQAIEVTPLIGDIYAGYNFKDGYQRTIIGRLLIPGAPNYLVVYVKYSYPNLVELKKESKTLTESL